MLCLLHHLSRPPPRKRDSCPLACCIFLYCIPSRCAQSWQRKPFYSPPHSGGVSFCESKKQRGTAMKFQDIVRQKRKELGLTQEQAARRLGVSPAAVSKWESGVSLR